jgi:ribonuclease HI
VPFFFDERPPLFCRYNTRFRPARLCSTGIFSWDFFQPKLEFSVPDEPIAAEKSSVTIYTDGAAEPNPGPGGYGIVLMAGKHRKELSGGFRLTTNNRMELMGVIVALEALSKPCLVNLYSDSKYVVDTVQRGSVLRWQKNRWLRSPGQPVKNVDLWKRYLVASARHSIRFHWVKGHAGVAENERCDELAVAAIQQYDLADDQGYLSDPSSSRSLNPQLATRVSRPIPLNAGPAVEPSEGAPCRKCTENLVKKTPKPKARKPGQTYFYEWYLFCPGCGTMYMVNEAKRSID